jgi:hypothetical protein
VPRVIFAPGIPDLVRDTESVLSGYFSSSWSDISSLFLPSSFWTDFIIISLLLESSHHWLKFLLSASLRSHCTFTRYFLYLSACWPLVPKIAVRSRPKPSDFSGTKIHSMPSFGGEVTPSVPCCKFAACKRALWFTWKSESQAKLTAHFSPIIPSFTNRGLSCRMTWSASGDDGRN